MWFVMVMATQLASFLLAFLPDGGISKVGESDGSQYEGIILHLQQVTYSMYIINRWHPKSLI